MWLACGQNKKEEESRLQRKNKRREERMREKTRGPEIRSQAAKQEKQ